jgi:putative transposase
MKEERVYVKKGSIDYLGCQRESNFRKKIIHSRTLGKDLQASAQIVISASEGKLGIEIQEQYGIEEHRIGVWRKRFYQAHEHWKQHDPTIRAKMNERLIQSWLSNETGRGRKAQITAEQRAKIIALACEPPSNSGYPHTQWSVRLLTQEVIKRGIIEYISFQRVWFFLKGRRSEATQKPVLPEVGGKRKRAGRV